MRFSIRDLLLVMVIVAVVATWVIDHRKQAREIQELELQEQRLKKAMAVDASGKRLGLAFAERHHPNITRRDVSRFPPKLH